MVGTLRGLDKRSVEKLYSPAWIAPNVERDVDRYQVASQLGVRRSGSSE